jgi:hypothetical protein
MVSLLLTKPINSISKSVMCKYQCSKGPKADHSGLSQELSSLARMLRFWVRIPLEAWVYVCVYSDFVIGSGLVTG